ncbi:hypothetical protein HF670_02035 [Acidithiobacillus thiooxidans]|uniref:hypothetical protein n=1 Tax=Acidithiobacillus thiooxidans TaxID=930 RepID=UPI001C07EC2C|nr:hypothetical protein [Acidithiobacillus thiooxidans]MBU2838365.1 hypothetical protein [Acidithiobacillus thiooxidans]
MRNLAISSRAIMNSAVRAAVLPPRSRPLSSVPKPVPKEGAAQQPIPMEKKARTDHRAIANSVSEKIISTRDPDTGWMTGLWEHAEKNRLYQVDLCQDLFGEWLLVDTWWRKNTAFGGRKKTYLGFHLTPEQVREAFYAASLRRSRHRYQPIDWRTYR